MVVVDSSVIIHFTRIGKLTLLKRYFNTIKITKNIFEEIIAGTIGVSEIKDASKNWIKISEGNFKESKNICKTEGIEEADASIILFAKKENDTLLSNDLALVNVAKTKGIICWWPTTFLIKSIEKEIITKKQAKQILLELIESGMRLKNDVYATILTQIDRM